MRLLWLLLLVPAVAAEPYTVVDDPAGDQAPFADAKFDIVQVAVEGDDHTLTVAVTMSDDVRQQRGQHAVGIRGSGFHVHVACYIGQTGPLWEDPEGCAATDVYADEGAAPAGITEPFAQGDPIYSDDGHTWSFTFDREAGNVPVGATADRIYAQSKVSIRLPEGGETSPGAAGYSEADNAASDEYIDLGEPRPAQEPEEDAPVVHDRDAPGPLALLPIAAALLARRR